MEEKKILLAMVPIVVVVVIVGVFAMTWKPTPTIEEKRAQFIELKESIQDEMRQEHKYRCCLEKPCVYCIEKTPGHGEGTACDCLKDVMEGVHPCGECIGEILEGHGNSFLAENFARAIAEEVGEEHIDELREIISEKYEIPVEEQL